MNNKSNTLNPVKQLIPAGVAPNDHNIEFVGVSETMTVIWLRCGNNHAFKNLPNQIYNALEELFLSDTQAVAYITQTYPEHADNLPRMVEIYTVYIYGQCDTTPDVIDGKLQPCENFRETADCPSMNFSNKYFDINGVKLNQRDLQIIDDMVAGLPDKAIAHKLGISQSTFDFHKRNLFKKTHSQSKVDLVVAALNNQVNFN